MALAPMALNVAAQIGKEFCQVLSPHLPDGIAAPD